MLQPSFGSILSLVPPNRVSAFNPLSGLNVSNVLYRVAAEERRGQRRHLGSVPDHGRRCLWRAVCIHQRRDMDVPGDEPAPGGDDGGGRERDGGQHSIG